MTGHPIHHGKHPYLGEKPMRLKLCGTNAFAFFVLVVALSAAWQVHAQDVKTPYPDMAPLDRYLMERVPESPLPQAPAVDPTPGKGRAWSSDGMVTKPRSKARTVSCAW